MVWGRRQSCSYLIHNGKNRMRSSLLLQRDFEEGDWLLAADFYLSFFAAAVCILVGLAFVLCQASTWPNRGVFSRVQTVQPETVWAAGGGLKCIVGSGGPFWGRDPRGACECSHTAGGESRGWEGTGGLLEPAHLPSGAGRMRAGGEKG